MRGSVVVMCNSQKIQQAPVMVPNGPWKVIPGGVTAPKGFKAAGLYGGLRSSGNRPDLSLIVSDEEAIAGGVFTTNIMKAAPVTYCQRLLQAKETARAVLTNAGQANAATGKEGDQNAEISASEICKALKISKDDVLLMSTGVIGQQIKMDALLSSIDKLVAELDYSTEAGTNAAIGITTTDLVYKQSALQLEIGDSLITVGGTSKGSGMIHPNMGTMLGCITCDAQVTSSVWRSILKQATFDSFNQISVDGDTSTNDTVLGLANGVASEKPIDDMESEDGVKLLNAVTALMRGLAKNIAWDGEGANCLFEVRVSGSSDNSGANQIARSIASSSLTKAAIFGCDPNWGRIACAAGYAGVPFDINKLKICLGPHKLMEAGQPLEFDRVAASKYIKDQTSVHGTVEVDLQVGEGSGQGFAWGCDLSYDYVKINAEYTT